MSISSLGRSIAGASLREPVSPLSASERLNQATKTSQDLAETQVTQEVTASSDARVEEAPQKRAAEVFEGVEVKAQEKTEQSTADAVAEMTELLHKRNVTISASGPLNRPDFKVIDRVNNIDFERAIPPQNLRDRVFAMREAFIADLSKDTISFDTSAPIGRRVIVIKENINETEFVRQIPKSYNEDRVAHLTSFASERGFNFETVA